MDFNFTEEQTAIRELAREIFQHLSKLLKQWEGTRADDPLELLDIRDLAGPRISDRLLRWIPTSEWRDRNHAETKEVPC